MTVPARALEERSPLSRLLDESFSDRELGRGVDPELAVPWPLWEASLYGPLAELFARPGKALRWRLVDAAFELGGGAGPAPIELGAIIEALHAGSLVIDDIEDGSTERRGAPALHCRVGVPIALNAASWLYFWPHALLERLELAPALELAARRSLGQTLIACHSGQALDLGVRVFELERADVPQVVATITRLKTGALVELAATLGALAAGAKPERVAPIARFGRELGIGLQMLDDTSGFVRADRRHKALEDLTNARAIWPFAWVAERLPARAWTLLADHARGAYQGERSPERLADEIGALLGEAPERRARDHLERALSELEAACGRSRALSELRALSDEMERAYV